MSKTADTGVDFVQRISNEIKSLMEQITDLQRTTADLQSGIALERRSREGDVSALHERLSQERAAETLVRNGLEKRQDEFEGKAKTWIAALGKDSVATKEQLSNLDTTVADRAARQAAMDDRRFAVLESAMPTKSSTADVQRIAAELAAVLNDAARDRATAEAAVKAAAAQAAHDFRMAEEHLDRLQRQVETNKKASVADLSELSSKVDGIEAFMQTRAKATDLQALEPRVGEGERTIEKLVAEMQTKSAITTLNAVSDRLTGLTMDVQTNQARAQADKQTLTSSIASLEKSLAKTDRQIESERERTSNCFVALEKEIAVKAAKAETDQIGPKTLSAAVDRIESRALSLESQIRLNREEVPPIRSRIDALEAAFPTKADASEIPRLALSIADHAAKHEILHKCTEEHNTRIEKVDGKLQHHMTKVEAVESRALVLERQITTKAEAGDHYTKDYTTDMFRDYYRRDEVDAMLSRVWWRVGDMTKGRMTSQLAMGTTR